MLKIIYITKYFALISSNKATQIFCSNNDFSPKICRFLSFAVTLNFQPMIKMFYKINLILQLR